MGQQNTKPITIEKQITKLEEQVLSQKVNFPFENIQKAVDFLEHKKYIVENGFLGMGGSAIVMKACSEDNDYLAIKFLVNPSQSQIKACQQEFEILSQYQTPHIIKVYDMIQEEHESINYQILIMERCAYDLKSFLERNKSNKKVILNAQINNICLELAKGLRELHSRNILHLDIKPANILYGIDLMWKYADLGISKSLQNKDHTEHLEGFTAQYSSPEQYQLANCNFRTSITKSSDIYSLGLVFMELTGVDLMKKWVFKQQLKEGNFEKYLNPNFEQINKIIMQMVCYDSEERLEIDNVVLKIKQLIKNEYESNQNKSKVQVLKRVQSNNILLQKEEFRDNSPINQNRKNSNLDVDQNTALYCNKKIQPNQLKKQKQQENLVQNCLKMILLNGRQISREIF